MDYSAIINALRAEIQQIDRAIADLEALNLPGGAEVRPKSRRGRRSMSEAERQQVSERMKRYWARRRKGTS
jgi:hypothetical protein